MNDALEIVEQYMLEKKSFQLLLLKKNPLAADRLINRFRSEIQDEMSDLN